MAEQQKKEPQKAKQTEEESEPVEAKDLTNEELDDDVDAILADIDDVLEENAQAFIDAFVQQGGQ